MIENGPSPLTGFQGPDGSVLPITETFTMAKSRDYQVKLYPAHKDGGFVVTKFDVFGTEPYPEKLINAAGMLDLIEQIAHFALAHGEGCQASVRVADGGRKPPGFSRATSSLYFNLKTKAEIEAAKASEPVAAATA